MKHTIQRQLTVALENQPGRLAAVCKLLAAHGINIRDITILDNIEQGVIRMIPSDAAACKTLLVNAGFYVVEADVLVVDLADNPGQLARLSQALADAQINIDYAYGSEDDPEVGMRLVLKVSQLARACEVVAALPRN